MPRATPSRSSCWSTERHAEAIMRDDASMPAGSKAAIAPLEARGWLAQANRWLAGSWGRKTVIGIPYLFLLLFFSLPFLVVLKISVSETEGVHFKDLFEFLDGTLTLRLKLANYQFLASDPLYLKTYVSSIRFAAVCTVLCLFIGYPFAYF